VFHAVLEEADLPKRMLEFSNLREQVSFVHAEDKEKALDQSKDIIRGAVMRAQFLEDVPRKSVDVIPKAALIGGGIANMTAALELANKGFEVYLIEQTPSLGGNMAKLDRIFPTDECCI
jgi:heterodisulfide reductase subunit A